jgi:hypothetical protein
MRSPVPAEPPLRAVRRARIVVVAPLLLVVLCACGGGGGGGSGDGLQAPPAAPPTTVTISGQVTFDKVPFGTGANAGLLFAQAVRAPARGVTVEAIAAGGATVLGSAVTDSNGRYSIAVPASTSLFVRARAEMRRAGTPGWTVSVRDNTSDNAMYALDGTSADSGVAAGTRDLHASATAAAGGVRPAGPFSLLDAVWQAQQLVLGADAATVFPELRLYWSVNNVACTPAANFCDGTASARARGEIGTSFYQDLAGQGPSIYVLGALASDSDEFDQHVVAHEWGHYYQDSFSRDDSLGGEHTLTERLDLRVAFSEGWGNAFAGMAMGDPVYRDSFGANGASGFSINVEANAASTPGWFSEASVQSLIWDLFDAVPDAADTVALGFGPIHGALRGAVRSTAAFTSVFGFLNAVRTAAPAQAGAINALAAAQSIAPDSDDFGSGETNAGADARNLPVFPTLLPGQVRRICSNLPGGSPSARYNKLGNRRFARFVLSVGGTVSIRASNGPAGSDPDIVLYSLGVERGRADGDASGTETLAPALGAGSYVVEVYEYSNINPSGTPRGDTCFDLQFTIS